MMCDAQCDNEQLHTALNGDCLRAMMFPGPRLGHAILMQNDAIRKDGVVFCVYVTYAEL